LSSVENLTKQQKSVFPEHQKTKSQGVYKTCQYIYIASSTKEKHISMASDSPTLSSPTSKAARAEASSTNDDAFSAQTRRCNQAFIERFDQYGYDDIIG